MYDYAIPQNNLIQARATMYSFLAELYNKEISPEVLSKLKQMSIEDTEQNTFFGDSLLKMKDYLSSFESDDELLDQLAIDFANLFLGANNMTDGSYPYESVYTSRDGLLCQNSTDEVFCTYLKDSFVQDMYYKVPDDHISLEFSYAASLLNRKLEATRDNNSDGAEKYELQYQQFFNEHMCPWIYQFINKGLLLANTEFYKGLFGLTNAFIASEENALDS